MKQVMFLILKYSTFEFCDIPLHANIYEAADEESINLSGANQILFSSRILRANDCPWKFYKDFAQMLLKCSEWRSSSK